MVKAECSCLLHVKTQHTFKITALSNWFGGVLFGGFFLLGLCFRFGGFFLCLKIYLLAVQNLKQLLNGFFRPLSLGLLCLVPFVWEQMTFARKQALWRKLTLLIIIQIVILTRFKHRCCFSVLYHLSVLNSSPNTFLPSKYRLKIYYFDGCGVISSRYTETNILARVIKIGNWETLSVLGEYGHLP